MLRLSSKILALAAAASAAGGAHAAVTYHFEQTAAALGTRFGLFLGGTGPVMFDFTAANALPANTTYNFGFSPSQYRR